jgi:hypothetical protein
MEHRWNETDRGKPKYSQENLSQYHFVHHKSHITRFTFVHHPFYASIPKVVDE